MSDDFSPAPGTWKTLQWAYEMGAATLGEAYDMLEQFENSNDVAEVLGEDDTIEAVREDIEYGLETVGPDTALDAVL
ncbi:hypothetical protein Aph02nite_81540 [Actinoplanes philippinensis]|uniref:Uncharacterized protein n=1 Tax=Actinoplanes philippinensis TaxID=35752 RepID=A0A1I2KWC1_9ACTN|nr:hypothetical protein [Actinoplanes philippinensis]GIE82204.1 hypothetical protein Aph02nite_81540 [Actinoplanes philippinensis]SFF70648.1 hypothetical protein SAMN05421541_118165 [Actinoplanes philippinensis]